MKEASKKSDLERTELQKTKSGVFTGAYAINPVSGRRIPVWVADYVLGSYGTGAVMAVPAHDQRDFEFALENNLPVEWVVQPSGGDFDGEGAFTGEGVAKNSAAAEGGLVLDGLPTSEAKEAVVGWLESQGRGRRQINYKLRDWLFARQRYWGSPSPSSTTGRTRMFPSRSRRRTSADLAGRGVVRADGNGGIPPRGGQRLGRVLQGWQGLRQGDKHDAPVGGILLVLPPILGPEEPGSAHRPGEGEVLDARGPLRGRRGAPPSSTSSTPGSGTRSCTMSGWSQRRSLLASSSLRE